MANRNVKCQMRGFPFVTLLIFGVTALFYSLSLLNRFSYDDFVHIVGNLRLQSPRSALFYFHAPLYPGTLYRPLPMLVFSTLHQFFGFNPVPYHLLAIVLHALNSVLVFLIIHRLLPSSRSLSLEAGLLFAAFPIHVETVANVSGVFELLAGSFALASLLFSFGHVGLRRSIAVAALALAAFLSKESALCLVLAMMLFHYAADDFSYRPMLAALASAIIYLGLRYFALGALIGTGMTDPIDNPLAPQPGLLRSLNGMLLLGRYALLTVAPIRLSADYSFNQLKVFGTAPWPELDLSLLLGGCLFVLLLALSITGLVKHRNAQAEESSGALHLASVFSLWFFSWFAATSNVFFPIGTIFGERLAYLPSIGIAGLLSLGLNSLSVRFASRLISALVVIYAVRAVFHIPVWRDNQSLFSYQLSASPESSRTQLNYASQLKDRGDFQGAYLHAKRAIEIAPENSEAAFFIGILFQESGRSGDAAPWYKQALRHNPWHVPAINALAHLELRNGRLLEAMRLFEQALKIEPGNYEARLGRLEVLARTSSADSAADLLPQLQELEQLKPHHPAAARLREHLLRLKAGSNVPADIAAPGLQHREDQEPVQ